MVRSAAMKPRASCCSVVWNAREKPRTPVSAPTPAATARMTNKKRPEEARVSRQAILRAVRYGPGCVMFIGAVPTRLNPRVRHVDSYPFQLQFPAQELSQSFGFLFGRIP